MLCSLLKSSSATGVASSISIPTDKTVRSWFVTSGTGAATVKIQVSHDGVNWLDYFSLSPSASLPDGYTENSAWNYVRANVTVNTGSVTLSVGY